MGPFKIKRQITHNTFEIEIPAAVRNKKRPVFHSSEFFVIGALTSRDGVDNPNVLPYEEELEHVLRVTGDNTAGNPPLHPGFDQEFVVVPTWMKPRWFRALATQRSLTGISTK